MALPFVMVSMATIIATLAPSEGHNSVIGYVAIRFEPEVLRVPVGSSATGDVHVTVHVTPAMSNRPVLGVPQVLRPTLNISACSIDPDVADVTWWPTPTMSGEDGVGAIASCIDQRHHKLRPSGHVTVSMTSSKFELSVRGFHLGRTRIKFYVLRTHRRHAVASSLLPVAAAKAIDDSKQDSADGNDAVVYIPLNDVPGAASIIQSESFGDASPFVPDTTVSLPDLNVFTEGLHFAVDTLGSDQVAIHNSSATADKLSVAPRTNADVQFNDGGYSMAWNASGTATLQDTVAIGNGRDYDSDVELWWIAHDYEIKVVNDVERSTASALRYAMLALTAVNLIGIGVQLEWSEVVANIKQPSSLAVALFSRQALMPTVGVVIAELFQTSIELPMLGILCLQCSPSEGASVMLTHLVQADLALSAMMSLTNSIVSLAFLPLWTYLFAKITAELHEVSTTSTPSAAAINHVQLPLVEMFVVVVVQVFSIGLGLVLSRRCSRPCFRYWQRFITPLTVITLITSAVVDLCVNWSIIRTISSAALLLCVGASAVGYLLGLLVAYLSGRTPEHLVVVSLETGARTTFLVGALLTASMPEPEVSLALGPPALYAVMSVLPVVAVGIIYRSVRRCRINTRYAEAACKLLSAGDSNVDDVEELCLQPQLIES